MRRTDNDLPLQSVLLGGSGFAKNVFQGCGPFGIRKTRLTELKTGASWRGSTSTHASAPLEAHSTQVLTVGFSYPDGEASLVNGASPSETSEDRDTSPCSEDSQNGSSKEDRPNSAFRSSRVDGGDGCVTLVRTVRTSQDMCPRMRMRDSACLRSLTSAPVRAFKTESWTEIKNGGREPKDVVRVVERGSGRA